MFDIDRWQEIWITITRNKMRSFLTAFGVFWGIFMLVVMSGSGSGLKEGIMKNIKGFATNTAFFWTEQTSEPYKGFRKGRFWSMKMDDIEALRAGVKEIKYISPILFGGRSTNNVVFGEKAGTYSVKGILSEYNKIDEQELLYGRSINEIDNLSKRKVCVIGRRIHEELFEKGKSPVGELLKVNGMYYIVVGVTRSTSDININGNSDETVTLPYTTMQQAYNYGDDVYFMVVTAQDNIKIGAIEETIRRILKNRHHIAPTDAKAVGGMNLEKQFNMFNNLFLGINILIWIVGLGTLIAGVVGVSNIMLVTVKERTKEIGIRRALGAKPNAIITQILSESLVLTLIAGVFGLMSGVGLLGLIGMLSRAGNDSAFFEPQIQFSIAITALAVLAVFGLLAGLIPAGRAIKIKAIDAIREE
ncbi:MAG: ABC transporter permease [Bacteroidales bacterium]|nr:ABC transporter permease [Bacteroidales bacterium]